MTPEQQRSASSSPPPLWDGEIVALEEDCVRVRLESGVIGILAETQIESSFEIGQHRRFQVLRCDENGEALLSLVAGQEDDDSPTFKHDVDEPQSALTNHRTPHATREDEGFPTLDEQRIQQWLNRVDKTLTKLRRNRAKRLDEEFYSG
jgi:predicted RNA-binding protein with RPS1 domain